MLFLQRALAVGVPGSLVILLALKAEARPVAVAAEKNSAVDHSAWDAVLKECTVPNQRRNGISFTGFDYKKLERKMKREFKGYLATVAATDIEKLTHDEKLAFMINAYNAFTVDVVMEHHPKHSIRDLSSFWHGSVFKRYKHTINVGGSKKKVSLDDVEHDYIRGKITNHKDPRVHSAINCASVSCPDLRGEAFTGAKLQEQLNDQVTLWMANTGKGLKVDAGSNTVHLSKIFDWFSEDFASQGKLEFAARFAPESARNVLLGKPRVRYLGYDWDLNRPQQKT
ncbi:hypothetical protein BSKO_11687 [Bryopsis sp. KO-2023]|nr:hypothetical protein BSKO_11687 [Bryopsis sp. KO-2023]